MRSVVCWVVMLLASSALVVVGCDDETEADADGDSDGDADGDADGDSEGDADADGDGDGDSGSPCDVLSEEDCAQANGCQTFMAWELQPYPIGPPPPNYCMTGERIFAGCGPVMGCGDAETSLCDAEGVPALFSQTCGPVGWTACDPGEVADSCE